MDPEKKKISTPRMTQDTDMHEHRPLRYQLCKLVRDKGESKDSCTERCALQWRQLSASSFRKQLLSNPDIGVWGQELGFPPDGRKQPTISENKSLVPLHVLAELHVWTGYHLLDGEELAWRATGSGESWHLQTRSP